MMVLLVFAYLKEAQSFIDLLELKPYPLLNLKLYKNENYLLLITGEGIVNATLCTTSVLTHFNQEIQMIFNLGIAGAINPKISKFEIFEIRTNYAFINQKLEFKSFSFETKKTPLDLLTVNERVLSLDAKKQLSHHGDLIDREAYGISQAAHFFKKPIKIIKIVSDELADEEFCEVVKSNAPLYSEKLADYFLENHAQTKPQHLNSTKNEFSDILNNPHFHFTHSLFHQTQNLLQDLKLKNISLKSLIKEDFYLELIKEEIPKKEKSKRLNLELKKIVDPIGTKVKTKLQFLTDPFLAQGIHIKCDPDLESPFLDINFKTTSKEDLEHKVIKLKQIDYDSIEKIFKGKIY